MRTLLRAHALAFELLIAVLVLAITSCGANSQDPWAADSQSSYQPSGNPEIQSNRERWAANGPSSYQFTFARHCFCLTVRTGSTQVTVRGGVITGAIDLSTGAAIDPSSRDLQTVDGLFDELDRGIQEGAQVSASYDPHDGHPLGARFDYAPYGSNADEDVGFSLWDLQPLW